MARQQSLDEQIAEIAEVLEESAEELVLEEGVWSEEETPTRKKMREKAVTSPEETAKENVAIRRHQAMQEKKFAKKIAFAWRIILTEMQSKGAFDGEVPAAFTATIGDDGSLILDPYELPDGVIFVPEENNIEMPAPLQSMISEEPSAPLNGPLRAPKARRGLPPSKPVPPASTTGLRTIHSSEGKASVIEK